MSNIYKSYNNNYVTKTSYDNVIFHFLKFPEKYANNRLGLNNINSILKEYMFKNIIRRDKQNLKLSPDLV
jgi:hypothetical protein